MSQPDLKETNPNEYFSNVFGTNKDSNGQETFSCQLESQQQSFEFEESENTDWQNLPLISHVLEERKVELILSWILKKHVLLVKYNTAEKTSQQRL